MVLLFICVNKLCGQRLGLLCILVAFKNLAGYVYNCYPHTAGLTKDRRLVFTESQVFPQ